jgi:hypothetical protein
LTGWRDTDLFHSCSRTGQTPRKAQLTKLGFLLSRPCRFFRRAACRQVDARNPDHYPLALMVPGDGIKRERSKGERGESGASASSLRLPPQL